MNRCLIRVTFFLLVGAFVLSGCRQPGWDDPRDPIVDDDDTADDDDTGDDGIFWMPYEDFCTVFTRLDLCQNFFTRSVEESWHHVHDHALLQRFMSSDALHGNWQHAPHWRLTPSKACNCVLTPSLCTTTIIVYRHHHCAPPRHATVC